MSNTLLTRMPVTELPDSAKQAWNHLKTLTGEPSFVEVFGQAPGLLDFVMKDFYQEIFFGGKVAQRYKQLVRLKLSLIHGCRTCNKQNVVGAKEAGITQEEIDALGDYQAGPFGEADQAVLGYTELMAMNNNAERLSPDLYQALSKHFSDEEICELGVVMAVIMGMAKLSFVLDLVEREDYCSFN